MYIYWLISLPIVSIIIGCLIATIGGSAMKPKITTRFFLTLAWLISVIGAADYLVEGAPFKHRLIVGALVGIPFGLFLILFYKFLFWIKRKTTIVIPKFNAQEKREIIIKLKSLIDEANKFISDYRKERSVKIKDTDISFNHSQLFKGNWLFWRDTKLNHSALEVQRFNVD